MWIDVVAAVVLLFGIYAFIELAGFRTRWITRRSERTAESMYGNYADSTRAQRRYAKRHGGTWHDGSAHRRTDEK